MDAQQKLGEIKFLVYLHLDATCDQKQEIKPCQQVIRIAASVIDVSKEQSKIIDKFNRLVKPQSNPKLTQFCANITHISNEQLKDKKNISVVLEQFETWLKNIKDLTLQNFVFITWGNWAIKSCLLKELKCKKMKVPDFLHSYTDLKRIFTRSVGEAKNIFQAANMLKIDLKKDEKLQKSDANLMAASQIIVFLFNNKKFKPQRKYTTVICDLPNINVTTQIQYLLVLDFEATCQQNIKLKPCSQIIQFPVMAIDLKTLKIVSQFHHYVTPTYNPKLTKFCTQLTGITQEMVDNKLTIQKALQQLDKWIDNQKFLQSKNFTFVTCGDWDLASCLKSQVKAKNIQIPEYLKNYINIKKPFRMCNPQNQNSQGMMGMLKSLNIPHQGRHHSGIDDVRNICKICIQLIKQKGFKFQKKHISYVK